MSVYAQGPDSTHTVAFSITPSDTVNLSVYTKRLYVGGTGNVTVIMEDDAASVTLAGVPAGTSLPIRVKRVLATGTTATNLVGMV